MVGGGRGDLFFYFWLVKAWTSPFSSTKKFNFDIYFGKSVHECGSNTIVHVN